MLKHMSHLVLMIVLELNLQLDPELQTNPSSGLSLNLNCLRCDSNLDLKINIQFDTYLSS